MNILLINHYAGSPYYGMEFRPYYLAREWVKQGHNVSIIAASFSHLRQHNPEVAKDFQEEIIDGIKYVWLKTPVYGGSLARIKNIMTFVWKLNLHVEKIVKLYAPDLVIASSTYPIDNIPAYKIAKKARAKYSYEIHDLWPLSPMLIGGYSKYHPFIMVMQWGENFAYKHVDKVISLLWNAEEHCKEHGLLTGKFVCVPNGYDPAEWTEEKFHQQIPEEHRIAFEGLKGNIIVGFAGGFAASGAIFTLLKSAVQLKERKDIRFVLVGKGPEESNYRRFISEYNLDNVLILPAVKKDLVPSIISNFDIMPICGGHSPLHKYGTSPNKLTDCMLSAIPIVYSVDEPGCLVERVGCGYRTEAENIDEMTDALLRLCNMSSEERRAIGERGRRYAHENLRWSVLAEKFIESIN